ncbi:homing endonuclease [Lucifera butyrica]|uniref:Homing endonuclease n=1 Tax=Lucifera butyrica TaxID=1351585 RepID=A0A498RAM7_9FIRM|nr:hypothetical protein [Lucifera butyrica]VBB08447.1 homing endonuclease [Lucifera butyrica]VBB08481.1 homing endonuclease [Lucifera butyrica]
MHTLSLDWIYGFVWGCGSFCGAESHDERLLVRHHDKKLLFLISKKIGSFKPHKRNNTYAIRITPGNEFVKRIFELGWTSRRDKDRQYPQGDINQLEFIRGYCYTKAAITKPSSGKNAIVKLEGAKNVLDVISRYLVNMLDIKYKEPRKRSVNIPNYGDYHTFVLMYQAREEVPKIISLLEIPDETIRMRKIDCSRFIGAENP